MIDELKFHPNRKKQIEEYLRSAYDEIILEDSIYYTGTITKSLWSKSVQPAFTKHTFTIRQINRKNLIILEIEVGLTSKLPFFILSLVILTPSSLFGHYLKSFIPLLFGFIICVYGIILINNNNKKSMEVVSSKIRSDLKSIFELAVN